MALITHDAPARDPIRIANFLRIAGLLQALATLFRPLPAPRAKFRLTPHLARDLGLPPPETEAQPFRHPML